MKQNFAKSKLQFDEIQLVSLILSSKHENKECRQIWNKVLVKEWCNSVMSVLHIYFCSVHTAVLQTLAAVRARRCYNNCSVLEDASMSKGVSPGF